MAKKKAGRRGNNEGSIFERKRTITLKDGSTRVLTKWYAELNILDANGKRERVERFTADTRAKCQDWMVDILKERKDKGTIAAPSKQTVAAFLDEWLTEVVAHNRKPTTLFNYTGIVHRYLKPGLGHIILGKLTAKDLQSFYHNLLEKGLSKQTVRHAHAVLHRALEVAMKTKNLVNVADNTEAPTPDKYRHTVLGPDQARQLLEAAKSDRLYPLYVVLIQLGLRVGEALALPWANVDFEAGTLRVTQTVSNLGGKLVFDEPKSETSRRTLDLPTNVVAVLKQWKAVQAQERLKAGAWERKDLVFVTAIGTVLNVNNLRNRSLNPLLKKAGLPHVRIHDLRHTALSMMSYLGASPKEVQEAAGHEDISTTMNIYGHVFREQKKAGAERLDAFWAPTNKKKTL